MPNTNAYIMTDDVINLIIDNEPFTITGAHVNFDEISEELTSEPPIDWDHILYLTDVAQTITAWGNGVLSVVDGVVMYFDREVHNAVADRILQGVREGQDVTPFVNFLENLMDNPSKKAIDELYLFLQKAEMPITEDGCFLAYKNVSENYTDRHSGTFDNNVGAVCQMDRNAVDDVRDNTCSQGLHFCALSYLREMWGFRGHTMIVKINPADVVSIPSDYKNAKGRTCRYEVIGELRQGHQDNFFGADEESSVYDEGRAYYGLEF